MKLTNFRDIGGITTPLGKIAKKRLLRSGELFELPKSDIQMLRDEYQLRLILDLRSPNEFQQRPDTMIDDARYVNLDIMKNLADGNTGFDTLLTQLDLAQVDEHMKQVYRDIIFDKYASTQYHTFMTEIANLPEGSALFHCYAGKDRTGLGAALLLETLGASRDDIYADYLLTNVQREDANSIICQDAAQQYSLTAEQTAALEGFLLVKEEYIDETYRTIEAAFGSPENYMLQGLKLKPETLEKIRTNYLVGVTI